MRDRQARILWAVLAINGAMFVFEFAAGWWASSTALMADSLDMLGDALVYGLSLFVVAKSVRWKAISAGFKGTAMLAFGLLVLAQALVRAIAGHPPAPGVMAGVGVVALGANIVCLGLVTRYRGDDVNMRSSRVCSRYDLLANAGVLIAAAVVAMTGSLWPDVAVGVIVAGLFLHSCFGVLRDARANLARDAASKSLTDRTSFYGS